MKNSDKALFLFFGWVCLFFQACSEKEEQYVLLISLDGYRYDYTKKFQPENLQEFIKNGTAAQSLIPSFPSKTFPNHYSIATGMRPETHGLVDNAFYEPEKDLVYSILDRSIVEDGYWYGGTPLWVLAERHGLKSASYFFVGSEADVQGVRPSYYYNYDAAIKNEERIQKVLEWLQLPKEERPRLITLYFSDMDDIGHRYGPGNEDQLKEKLHLLDLDLAGLFAGIQALDLSINVFIVSDHGMVNVPKENLINLDRITENLPVKAINNGALAHIHLDTLTNKEQVLQEIKSKAENIQVVDIHDKTHYKNLDLYPQRLGDILLLPNLGHYLATDQDMIKYQNRSAMFKTDVFGEHGYSPDYREMHGIFYANGPKIKEGFTVLPFENIHIYPLVCEILGLPVPEDIDGDGQVLKPILKD